MPYSDGFLERIHHCQIITTKCVRRPSLRGHDLKHLFYFFLLVLYTFNDFVMPINSEKSKFE